MGGVEAYISLLWEKIAYACRYANQSLDVVMMTDTDDLDRLVMAVASIVREENKDS